jgi:hypothetical protein
MGLASFDLLGRGETAAGVVLPHVKLLLAGSTRGIKKRVVGIY